MGALRQYRRRSDTEVIAIRLNLDTPGLSYKKWGGDQMAKPGDWLVENDGEVYSVDADSFALTYRRTAPGTYAKCGVVWAEVATEGGKLPTAEGTTDYAAGDYLVYNDPKRLDGYAMGPKRFAELYEPDPGAPSSGDG